MSVSEQILRIQDARNMIRAKLVALGLVASTADIDDCATAVDGIENRGAVSAQVTEGATYTIPKGYHNGSGTVSGVKGGGNYSLQSKTATPTKSQQNVTPDAGYYGLSDVTVEAIPENYQDVTPVTAGAGDVLATKVIVDATGKSIAGTMPNNGAVSATLNTGTTSYTVPAGYHSGSGKVSITTETKSATPTKSAQDITPSSGKVLSKVTVAAIPDKYQDISGTTATPALVLSGYKFVASDGKQTEGTMPSITPLNQTLGTTFLSYTIPAGYHDGNGSVSINPETKTITPTKSTQTVAATTTPTLRVISSVTVNPIPDEYQDVTGTTAEAGDVLAGEKFINAEGEETTGTMTNRGAVSATLNTSTTSYTVPAGYHNGSGKISITTETKSVTPTKSAQTVTPTSGKVLSSVSVAAIPSAYQDVTGVTAAAANVLDGKYFVTSTGVKTEGTMANNGAISKTIDGLSTTSATIPAGYTSGGTVSLTGDIEAALAAI